MIAPEQTLLLLEKYPTSLLLDVRDPEEYALGYIPGATLVPLRTILQAKSREELRSLGLDIAAQEKGLQDADSVPAIIVYCHSGVRSAQAKEKLERLGFAPVYDAGGIVGWPYELVRD